LRWSTRERREKVEKGIGMGEQKEN
jgi:hypothetical protein